MAGADQVLKQLESCDVFFASQRGLISDSTLRASIDGMSSSLVAQIDTIAALDMDGASRMNTTVGKTQSLTLDQKQKLVEAINRKAMTQVTSTTPQRRSTQTLTNLASYFPEVDWLTFESEQKTTIQKVVTCCDRLMMVGLRNASEQTVRHVVAFIAATHCPNAPPGELHSLVQDVKATLQSKRSPPTASHLHLHVYPDDPKTLPNELYAAAYKDNPPVTKDMPGLTMVLAKVPMRSSNRQLGRSSAAAAAPPASSASAQPSLNVVAQLLQQLMGLPQHTGDGLHNLVITPPRRSPSLQLSALQGPATGLSPNSLSIVPDSQPANVSTPPPTPIQGPMASPIQAAMTTPIEVAPTGGDDQQQDEPDLEALVRIAAGNIGMDISSGKGKAKGKAKSKAAAKCKGKAKAKAEAPPCSVKAKAKAKSKATAKAKAKATPSSTSAKGKSMILGCSKCRGSPKGCVQCRNPGYKGHRYTRK